MEFNKQYLTYNEYQKLGGKLRDESSFNLLEFEARKRIDLRTQRRLVHLEEQPEEVKWCVYNLINRIQNIYEMNSKSQNVASESVGKWSITYATGSQLQEVVKANKVELDDIILNSLFGLVVDGIEVLYLGVL